MVDLLIMLGVENVMGPGHDAQQVDGAQLHVLRPDVVIFSVCGLTAKAGCVHALQVRRPCSTRLLSS